MIVSMFVILTFCFGYLLAGEVTGKPGDISAQFITFASSNVSLVQGVAGQDGSSDLGKSGTGNYRFSIQQILLNCYCYAHRAHALWSADWRTNNCIPVYEKASSMVGY